MAFTKAEIARQNGFPKLHSAKIIETLLEIIKKTLGTGDDGLVSEFGKFCAKEKKATQRREPCHW